MTRADDVLARAEPLAVPPDEEAKRVGRVARFALSKTRAAAKRRRGVKDVVLGGSFAKGTWLPHHADVDIFVRFLPDTPEREFEREGLAIGGEAAAGFPKGKKYAQHPYTEASIDGVKVNIVPCFAVRRREWRSAADRSPFHVGLVKKLPEAQKTQVRLVKMFMRAVGVYGAEIQTQGFSGYVAEVLTIQHRTALGVVRYFADFKRHSQVKMFSLPDPVDPSRDLAVAVSGEKLGRMVLASRAFLGRPSASFLQQASGKQRPSIRGRVLCVIFTHQPLSEDTLWGELRKSMKHLVRHAEGRGFRIARAVAASNNSDSSAFLILPEVDTLPPLEQRVGPNVELSDETASFIHGNRRRARLVWIDGDSRVRILQDREHVSLSRFLETVVKGRSGPIGVSEEVGKGMEKSARVLSGKSLESFVSTKKWLAEGMVEIVSDAIGTRYT